MSWERLTWHASTPRELQAVTAVLRMYLWFDEGQNLEEKVWPQVNSNGNDNKVKADHWQALF